MRRKDKHIFITDVFKDLNRRKPLFAVEKDIKRVNSLMQLIILWQLKRMNNKKTKK